jgi:hypothetical protein
LASSIAGTGCRVTRIFLQKLAQFLEMWPKISKLKLKVQNIYSQLLLDVKIKYKKPCFETAYLGKN